MAIKQYRVHSDASGETLYENETSPQSTLEEKNEMDEAQEQKENKQCQEKRATNYDEPNSRRDTNQVLTWDLNDPEHPTNWPTKKKALVLSGGIVTVLHSTLGSSLPSNAVSYISSTFGITSQVQMALPISIFLVGYCFAPTCCGPLSEHFGRKPVMLSSFIVFVLFTMACAVAPTWASFLFFRFMCGLAASAPIACVGGIFADINAHPSARGKAMAVFMVATVFGPVLAPPLSGFIAENTTWRWVFGVATLFAAGCLPVVILMPETYAPTLLSKRAAKMRAETGNDNIIASTDLQKKSFRYIMTIVMARPYKMLFEEVIVSTTCLYLALCYGVFYLYFEAYPIIFLGPNSVYKFSPGIAGLTFLPIALGGAFCLPIFWWWDSILTKAQARNDHWAEREEFRRLPLAMLGGPLYGISMIWLGWASKPNIHWIVPTLSGLPFGMGFLLIFMAMLTYLSDAYMTYNASAQGMASTARSLLGVLLPLAAPKMFQTLGIAWACSTLGFLSLALGLTPWLFMIYGEKIRANSKFCLELKAIYEKEQEERNSAIAHQDIAQA